MYLMDLTTEVQLHATCITNEYEIIISRYELAVQDTSLCIASKIPHTKRLWEQKQQDDFKSIEDLAPGEWDPAVQSHRHSHNGVWFNAL